MSNAAVRKAAITLAATVAIVVTPASASADAGLIAQWRFDEGDGQVVRDDGPFGLDGTLGSTDGVDARDPGRIPGASGGALHFDGSALVRLPEALQLAPQQLTVEAMVSAPASPGSNRYLVSRGGSGCVAGSYGLYTAATGGVAFYVFDGERYVLTATALEADVWDGGWHDVTGTYDGRRLRLFIDGREVGSPMAATLRIDYSTSGAATLGQYAGDCDLPFAGDLDLVRIFSGAVEHADPVMNPVSPSATSPLTAAAPGTTLPGRTPGSTPTASPPTCSVRLSRQRMIAGRRAVVRAQLLHAPRSGKLTLTARRGTRRKAVASARISASGRARLVVGSQRAGRLTVAVAGRTGCATARLTVFKR